MPLPPSPNRNNINRPAIPNKIRITMRFILSSNVTRSVPLPE
jgi:hypothetical protein